MNLTLWQKTGCKRILGMHGEAALRMLLIQKLGSLVEGAAYHARVQNAEARAEFILACAAVEVMTQALFGDAPERQHAGPAPATAELLAESSHLIMILVRSSKFGPQLFAAEEYKAVEKVRRLIEDAVSASPLDITQMKHNVNCQVKNWLREADR